MRDVKFAFLGGTDGYVEQVGDEQVSCYQWFLEGSRKVPWKDVPQGTMTKDGIKIFRWGGAAVNGRLFFRLPFGMLVRKYEQEFRQQPKVYNGEFDVTQVVRTRLELRKGGARNEVPNVSKSRGKRGRAKVSVR